MTKTLVLKRWFDVVEDKLLRYKTIKEYADAYGFQVYERVY